MWGCVIKQAFYSGTTAVVGLIKENRIYVANAGDSRCTMATMKNGKLVAQDLSIDQVSSKGSRDHLHHHHSYSTCQQQ